MPFSRCYGRFVSTEPDRPDSGVTAQCHDTDAVTEERHESTEVTDNCHESDAVTDNCHELDDVTLERWRIAQALKSVRQYRRHPLFNADQWPRHSGTSAKERQRFRRARLKLGIQTPQQLWAFLETHPPSTVEWRFLRGKGPFTPEERAVYRLGPETEQEREFWGTHTDEEKAVRLREGNRKRKQRQREKERKHRRPDDEVDIHSRLVEESERTKDKPAEEPTKAA